MLFNQPISIHFFPLIFRYFINKTRGQNFKRFFDRGNIAYFHVNNQ